MRLNDHNFLAAHISDFRCDVLYDLNAEELALMFGSRLELGVLIHQRFIDWRESVETDQAIEQLERDRVRAADLRAEEDEDGPTRNQRVTRLMR